MEIKSLEEIKSILKKFPKASGVGYVIAPQLIKIAIDCGLVGYREALENWSNKSVFSAKVFQKGEIIPADITGLMIDWEGDRLSYLGDGIKMGIEATIKSIEEIQK